MELQPLLADIGEVIGFLITLAIIGFSVISKIIQSMNEGPGQEAGQRPERPPAGPRPQARPGARSVEAEIEDFLRQARGERPPTPPSKKPGPPQPPQPASPPVVMAMPVEEDIVPGRDFGRELAEHVQEHIGNDSISQRDAHLGDVVEAADERIEHHLEEVFNHDLGQLAHAVEVDTSIAEGTDAKSWERVEEVLPAEKIANLLKSPESIRDVFIASEILKRPNIQP